MDDPEAEISEESRDTIRGVLEPLIYLDLRAQGPGDLTDQVLSTVSKVALEKSRAAAGARSALAWALYRVEEGIRETAEGIASRGRHEPMHSSSSARSCLGLSCRAKRACLA